MATPPTADEPAHISLAHGNGGRYMRELIDGLVKTCLGELLMDTQADAVSLPPHGEANQQWVFTSDGFTVQPLEFPGGDIGALSVHGIVNDLAVAGAEPVYLSINLVIEEGLAADTLRRLLTSLAQAAAGAGLRIAAGDTKVVPRGQGSGLYIGASGLGRKPAHVQPHIQAVRAGDRLLLSGPVGDHGIAVLLAREAFGLRGDVQSDSASVWPLCRALLALPGLRFMRDPTRGGLATVLHEIGHATGLGARLQQTRIPVRPATATVCELLGYEPYYLACEGRVLAVLAPDNADQALDLWRAHPAGRDAALIGTLTADDTRVILATELGGQRVLAELEDEPLPRIC